MPLTLKEKLSGIKHVDHFVSPYTDRKLKPFIYRDAQMNPIWLRLLKEVRQFNKAKRLRTPKDVENIVRDHGMYCRHSAKRQRRTSEETETRTDDKESEQCCESLTRANEKQSLNKRTNDKCFDDNKDDVEEMLKKKIDEDGRLMFVKEKNRLRNLTREGEHKEEQVNENLWVDVKDDCKNKKEVNEFSEQCRRRGERLGQRKSNSLNKNNENIVMEDREKEFEDKGVGGNITEDIRNKQARQELTAQPTNRQFSFQEIGTIDFCYVRPEHVNAINSLLEDNFWRNICIKECTMYPEFTVVALYKKLVIGVGAMIPSPHKVNEMYITFFATRAWWRNVGIGQFMLYHLISTCQSSQCVTLHCSASRHEALQLYFKFGFKVESIVLNFYKPYLDTNHCQMSPHAYYLKYSRNIA